MLIKTGHLTSFTVVIFFVLTWSIINEFEKEIPNTTLNPTRPGVHCKGTQRQAHIIDESTV